MPSNPAPPHSTRVENLAFAPGEARFELEGRAIRLNGKEGAPSVDAFRALYDLAAADYRARASPPRPRPLLRLLSWLGRALGAGSAEVPAWAGPAASPPEPPSRPAAPASRESPRLDPRPVEPPAKPPEPAPVLRAIFADKNGVHVVWEGPARTQCRSLEFTYALDSGVAQRLQRCYGRLSQLGYPVIGLEVLGAARVAEAERTPAAAEPGPRPATEPGKAPAEEKPIASALRKRAARPSAPAAEPPAKGQLDLKMAGPKPASAPLPPVAHEPAP